MPPVRKRKKTVPQSTPLPTPSEPINISDSESESNCLQDDVDISPSRKRIKKAHETIQRFEKDPSGSSLNAIPANATAGPSNSRQPAERNLSLEVHCSLLYRLDYPDNSLQHLKELVGYNHDHISNLSSEIGKYYKGDLNAPVDIGCLERLWFVGSYV